MSDHILNTCCKDCCFAVYDGLTQADCKLGRIEAFRAAGADVIESHDGQGNEFFVIRDRLCLAFHDKNKPWAKSMNADEQTARARAEMAVRIHYFIVCPPGSTTADVKTTFQSIYQQRPAPLKISILLPKQSPLRPAEVIPSLRAFEDVEWSVVQAVGEENEWQSIDSVLPSSKSNYYVVVGAGKSVLIIFASRLDYLVNDELKRPVLFRFSDFVAVNTVIHHAVGGSVKSTTEDGTVFENVLDKIRHVAAKEGCEDMVLEAEELCRTSA